MTTQPTPRILRSRIHRGLVIGGIGVVVVFVGLFHFSYIVLAVGGAIVLFEAIAIVRWRRMLRES